MSWYFFAFLAPLLWAVTNHIDKYVLGRYLKNTYSGVLAIFAGLAGFLFSLCIFIFLPQDILGISFVNAFIIILNGVLLIVAFIPYYYALNEDDVSYVVPLYQTVPIFSFLLGFWFLGETIHPMQVISGIFIIIGAVLISIDISDSKFKMKKRVLFLMLLSSFLIAIQFLVFKIIALQGNFWQTVFWEYIGAVLVGLFLFTFSKNYRRQFISIMRENSFWVIVINMLNEVINIAGKLCANFASLLVPVFVVTLANGLQPLFVFLIGLILTLFLPSISKEKITKKHILQKVLAIVVLLVGTYMLVL